MAVSQIISGSNNDHDESDHHRHDETSSSSSSSSLRDRRKNRPIIIIAATACTIAMMMTISHTSPTNNNTTTTTTTQRSLSYDLTPPPPQPHQHPSYLPPLLSSQSQPPPTSSDRTPLVETLTAAGVPLTPELISQLPTWSDITSLYGPTPIIYGLDRCDTFRAKNAGQPIILSPQGLFNTGTRHLRQLLESNCRQIGEVGNPFWWKHAPVFFAHKRETIYRKNDARSNTMAARFDGNAIVNVLSVTSVKDPFYWMGSMCRKKYNVRFKGRPGRCPVFDDASSKRFNDRDEEEEGVEFSSKNRGVDYTVYTDNGDFVMSYDNMSDLWNDFNKGHLVNSDFPRLMIRYEDTLFHTKEVVTQICECAGGIVTKNFNYKLETTKPKYGDPENMLVHAMIKYGSKRTRYDGFAEEDVRVAAESLDEELMGQFRYTLPPREGRIREEDEMSVNDAIDLASARTGRVVDDNY